MRTHPPKVWSVRACLSGAAVVLTSCVITSCATTTPSPRQFQNFYVPPRPMPTEIQPIDPPDANTQILVSAFYANEAPSLANALPSIPRPSDAEFLIKRADDYFASGKRAFQGGNMDIARRDFDRSIETLLSAPDNVIDRPKLERRVEQLVEEIYRYDVDQDSASDADTDAAVNYDESPKDDILNMTFPVDPSLRSKVQEQIRATSSQLPLETNDAVLSFVNYFSSTKGKKVMAYGLQHSGRYRAMIQRILREEGVPEELIYLAQAESGFSPRAMSKALCVGVWQFAAFRGREYGLNQVAGTDDRMDPERATHAAARHLHDLYDHFGDWYLAMAAYNCGPGCVDKAVQRTGYADFWELRRLNVLPKETANYVPAILAMTIIGKNAKDYGLDDLEFEKPVEYETVELESATHMALIADALDRPLTELRELNPSVMRSVAPAGHAIHVPVGTLPQVQAALQAVPSARRDSWRVHRMEAGETLADVAHRFSVTVSVLASANRASVDAPEAGSFIAVPVAYPGDRAPARSARLVRKPATRVVASTKASVKPVAAHPTAPHAAVPLAQHKPATKNISKAPAKPAARS
jgi:membrane-bound lytic murein transglycosylase D